MDLSLSDKVFRKNLFAYRNMSYSADLFSLSDLYFTSLPMFESVSSFEKCLSSDWGYSEDVEFSGFRSLCSILDKFNVDEFGLNLSDSNFPNLGLLNCIYSKLISGVMSGQFSCSEFEPDFRKIHGQFMKYKFRDSFCNDYGKMNRNGSVALVKKSNYENALKLNENFGMFLVYEKAQRVDEFISSLK
jgi:hypothetical protein